MANIDVKFKSEEIEYFFEPLRNAKISNPLDLDILFKMCFHRVPVDEMTTEMKNKIIEDLRVEFMERVNSLS